MVLSDVVAAHLGIHDNFFGRCQCFALYRLLLLSLLGAGQGLQTITSVVYECLQCTALDNLLLVSVIYGVVRDSTCF